MSEITPVDPEQQNPQLERPVGPQGDPKSFGTGSTLQDKLVAQYGPQGQTLFDMITKSMAMSIIADMQRNQARMKEIMKQARDQQ